MVWASGSEVEGLGSGFLDLKEEGWAPGSKGERPGSGLLGLMEEDWDLDSWV